MPRVQGDGCCVCHKQDSKSTHIIPCLPRGRASVWARPGPTAAHAAAWWRQWCAAAAAPVAAAAPRALPALRASRGEGARSGSSPRAQASRSRHACRAAFTERRKAPVCCKNAETDRKEVAPRSSFHSLLSVCCFTGYTPGAGYVSAAQKIFVRSYNIFSPRRPRHTTAGASTPPPR